MSDYENILPVYESSDSDDGEQPNKPQVESKSINAQVAFTSLGLLEELMRAIRENGFEHPSIVQAECIPPAIAGDDILCQAKAGMGKTAVFVFSILNMLDKTDDVKRVSAVILVHTRELAHQIHSEFERFKVHFKGEDGSQQIESRVFLGGYPVTADKQYLKTTTPQIVIGTPGRMLQLVNEGHLDLGNVKYFVVDECDKVLGPESADMRSDVQRIFMKTPQDRQVMMFSATLSSEAREICKRYMRNPHEVIIDEGKHLRLDALKQFAMFLAEDQKTRKLAEIFDAIDFNQVFVFVKSTKRAKALHRLLLGEGFPTIVLYGNMSQTKRDAVVKEFAEGTQKARIMVSTELCGRGMDFKSVNVVINYDMPEDSDMYMHRVGRAGRFGTKGIAISFVAPGTSDEEVLEEVKTKFVDALPTLESLDQIDQSYYMGNI